MLNILTEAFDEYSIHGSDLDNRKKNICFPCERETASCFAIAKANFSRIIGSEKK